MHEKTIIWILSNDASVIMASFAFLLMFLYVLQFFLAEKFFERVYLRKNRLAMRALNWGIFGGVFLLFGQVVPIKDVLTWRATARTALFFLMLPEIAYQITILWRPIKRIIWNSIRQL